MKKVIWLIVFTSVLMSCAQEKKTPELAQEIKIENVELTVTPELMETGIIYEANIRQYSPEGIFKAFTKDIPQLKQLGVTIIWLMPIFPISETKRKATGGEDSKFASEFPKEEQAKYLGSYYAVSDFKKINPEFGTIEDFRELVKTAHNNGIYIILDWVPNHTGWDHTWLKTNPEFYTRNKKGEVIHPKGTDWTDVADLNYDNKGLRVEMVKDMSHWIENEGIDGFRCDVASSVPTFFWEEAIPQLRAKKSIFMLAEAWEPELFKNNLFDMGYAWDGHHVMNALAKGEKKVKAWDNYIIEKSERYENDDILMNFVTNHDENSWNGTIKERMGEASQAMTVLSYLTRGMPLIYSGQEYDLDHKLLFFEKDSFPHVKGSTWKLLEQLGELKRKNKALHGGKNAAKYTKIETTLNKSILAFSREKENDKVVYISNVSDKETIFSTKEAGTYTNYFNKQIIELNPDKEYTLKPFEFMVLVKD